MFTFIKFKKNSPYNTFVPNFKNSAYLRHNTFSGFLCTKMMYVEG